MFVAIILLAATSSSFAQTLEFSGRPQPPALGVNTYANTLVQQLQDEIGRWVEIERTQTGDAATIIRAQINLRIIALEALEFADAAGAEGSHAAIVGLRLFDARQGIDEALRGIGGSAGSGQNADSGGARAMISAVERFNRLAGDQVEGTRTTDLRVFDRTLGRVFAPLAGAVAQFGPMAGLSHWVSSDEVNRMPATDAADGLVEPPPTIAQLTQRLKYATLSDRARDDLRIVLEFIERGEAFAELSRRVASLRAAFVHLLTLAEALPSFEPLGEQAVTRCRGNIEVIAAMIREPDRREAGLERIGRVQTLFDRMTTLIALREEHVNVAPLVGLTLAADRMLERPDERRAGESILVRLDQIYADILSHRALPVIQLPREVLEIRVKYRQLDRQYREAERSLLERLTELIDRPDALADPAFSSVFVDHRQLLDDLRRLQRIPMWLQTAEQLDGESKRRLTQQVRKMVNWLLDSNRRPEAIRAMDRFEQQIALTADLAFMDELAVPTTEAITVSGGRHAELLEAIAAARKQLCRAWADGNATSAAALRIYHINRLLRAMADAAQLKRMGEDASILNRWAAWEFPPGIASRPVSEIVNRCKLATAAVIDGDDAALARQMEGIARDAPLVMLLGRLGARIEPPLRFRAGGALGALLQCAHPPDDDAWMIRRRKELANLCRYTAELEHTRRTGADALTTELERYVHAAADELLEHLGQPRLDVQPLIGFDGSDPVPEID